MDKGLADYVIADSGVSVLVSTRVYTLHLPSRCDFPAIVYNNITETKKVLYDGPDGLVRAAYQLDIWARTLLEAKAVEAALDAALLGFRGLMGTTRVRCTAKSRRTPEWDPEVRLTRLSSDYDLWYEES